MSDTLKRSIEISISANDQTARGVESANRNLARVGTPPSSARAAAVRNLMAAGTGQAPGTYDLAGETPAARAIRATGGAAGVYQLAGFRARGADEQATRDAMAAELRAIRIQTMRAEASARQALLRNRARQALGLGAVGGMIGAVEGGNTLSIGRRRAFSGSVGSVAVMAGTQAAYDAANGESVNGVLAGVGTTVGSVVAYKAAEALVTRSVRPLNRALVQLARNQTLMTGALRFGRAALPYARAAGGPLALAAGGAYLAGNAFDTPDAYFAARATGASGIDAFGQASASLLFGNPGATLSRETNAEIRERLLARRRAADVARSEDLKSYIDDLRAERQARIANMQSRYSTPEDEELAATRSNLSNLERRLGSRGSTPDRLSREEREELEALRSRVNDLARERAGMIELQQRQTLAAAAERERVFNRQQAQSRADSVREQGRRVQLAERRVAMQRLGLAENQLQNTQDRQAAVSSTLEAVRNAGPMYAGNNLAGDVGAMVGIQSTGMSQNNALLNRLAEVNARQERQLEELNRLVRELVSSLEKITIED